MNLKIIIPTALISLTLIASCRQPSDQGSNALNLQKLKSYTAANIESDLINYEVVPEKLEAAEISTDAQKFGVIGASRSMDDITEISNERFSYTFNHKTGSSFYRDNSKIWGADSFTDSAVAPSEDQSIELAKEFIKERKLAIGDTPKVYQVNTLNSSTSRLGIVEPIEREVVFRRKVNGHVILGSGSQISIFVGKGNKIHGAFVDWPKLRPIKTTKLRDPMKNIQLMDAAISEKNKKLSPQDKISGFEVKKTRLEYAGFFNKDGSRTIIPVYALEGVKNGLERTEVDTLLITASDENMGADTDPILPLTPPVLPPSTSK